MKTASISQAKNQLSALIDQVRHGETVLITDHDRPVAQLVPAGPEDGTEGAAALSQLERKGVIRRGYGTPCKLAAPARTLNGASALATLLDEREFGR